MARPRKSIPKLWESSRGYLFAKDRDGVQHWFGHKSDPISGEKYAEFIARIQRGEVVAQVKRPSKSRPETTVSELCLRFLTGYATRDRRADGKSSAEVRQRRLTGQVVAARQAIRDQLEHRIAA